MGLSAHDELILLRKRARRRLVGAVVLATVSTTVLWNIVGHLPDQQMRPESVEISSEASAAVADTASSAADATASAPVTSRPVASAPHLVAANVPASAVQATQLPADLASVEPEKPQAKAAAPVVAAAAVAAGVVAADVAKKPDSKVVAAPPEKPSKQPPAQPAAKTADSKPAPDSKAATAAKPHKQPDPAAILEGRFDPEGDAPTHAKKSEPPKPEKVDNVANGKTLIQLAALSDPVKADALKAKLSSLGVSAHFSKVQTSKGEVTRVRVGPFASHAEAEATLKRLSQAGVTGIIVNK